MLILDHQNLDLKRLVNIQKCRSSTKVDHCGLRYYKADIKGSEQLFRLPQRDLSHFYLWSSWYTNWNLKIIPPNCDKIGQQGLLPLGN